VVEFECHILGLNVAGFHLYCGYRYVFLTQLLEMHIIILTIIGITYSCIAPLVLGFATIGMSFFYIAYKYNILFVTETQIDTKGLIYPRALQQLLTGVYLSELCLIGLFAIATAIGPLILMIAFFIFTVLFHLALNSALDPLLYNLPKSLEVEEEALLSETESPLSHQDLKNGATMNEKARLPPSTSATPKRANFLIRFLRPHIYSSYTILRQLVPPESSEKSQYEDSILQNAYFPPSVKAETPLLWIPRDAAGISRQEVWHSSKVVPITDEGCILDEKGRLVWDREGARPPVWREGVDF
jgi:calcium permeable stress-gated cation channel